MSYGTFVIVCYGNKFSKDYVANQIHSIEHYHSAVIGDHAYGWNIRILTDREDLNDLAVTADNGVELPGWWNKLKLFDSTIDIPGNRVIFLDLDTLITNKFDWLLSYNGVFMGIENLGINNGEYEDIRQYQGVMQSGILAFDRSRCSGIWRIFHKDREQIMKYFRGDGEYLYTLFNSLPVNCYDLLQKKYPERIMSYKYQAYKTGIVEYNSEDASRVPTSFVLFHGEPSIKQAMVEPVSPWGVKYEPREWVKNYWRA